MRQLGSVSHGVPENSLLQSRARHAGTHESVAWSKLSLREFICGPKSHSANKGASAVLRWLTLLTLLGPSCVVRHCLSSSVLPNGAHRTVSDLV